MNSDARRALVRGLYPLTNDACARCTKPYSCCRPPFCRAVAAGLRATGRPVPEPTGHPSGLPFMGERGCIIPPELRPLCTVYACETEPHTQTRDYKRVLEREREKAWRDPDVQKLRDVARETLLADPEIRGPLEAARAECIRLQGGPA